MEKVDNTSEAKWSFEIGEFREHLTGDNELQVVLRAHLYLEHVVIEFMKEALPKHHFLKMDRINFRTKVEIAASLDLIPDELIPAIMKVNELRNNVAHDLRYVVSGRDKKKFFDLFPDLGKELILYGGEKRNKYPLEKVGLGHMFKVLVVLIEIRRQDYVEWRQRKDGAFQHLGDVLENLKKKYPDLLGDL